MVSSCSFRFFRHAKLHHTWQVSKAKKIIKTPDEFFDAKENQEELRLSSKERTHADYKKILAGQMLPYP